jgi:hypothetical protein
VRHGDPISLADPHEVRIGPSGIAAWWRHQWAQGDRSGSSRGRRAMKTTRWRNPDRHRDRRRRQAPPEIGTGSSGRRPSAATASRSRR